MNLAFQFTASYEADQARLKEGQAFRSFNSQPHTRLTGAVWKVPVLQSLSIHSLIRGWPGDLEHDQGHFYLSIHSLIRGWPDRRLHGVRGRRFQFTASYEADQRKQPELRSERSFNSQPHTRLTSYFTSTLITQLLSIHSLIRGWPL